jgi:tetratricopeptide (TPR) repeat protein
VIKETSIDVSGHFTFRVGDQSRMSHILPDASQSIGEELASQNMTDANGEYVSPASIGEAISLVAMTQIFGCALRAELPGYESTSVILGGGSRTGLIQAGTIVLRPRTRVKGRIISAANLLAGKAARKELEAAKKAMEKNELSEAEASAKRAIAIYPKYADAWLVQGDLNELQNRNQEAREAYSKAIEIDNLFLGPYIGLAKLSAREKKWKDVAELTDKALALDPINMPDGHFLNALAYYNMNQLDLAEKSALRGRRLDLENRVPAINLILANVLLRKKDYAAAVDAMKAYLNAAPNAPDAAAVRARIQENEKLAKAK